MVIEILAILFEILVTVKVCNSIISESIRKKELILSGVYILLATIWVEMVNILSLDSSLTMLAYGITFLYCFILCKKVTFALYTTACAIVTIIVVEMILSIPVLLINQYLIFDNKILSLLISFIALLLIIAIFSKTKTGKELAGFYRILQGQRYIIVLILAIFLLYLYEIRVSEKFDYLDFIVFVVYFATILGVSYLWRKESVQNLKQKYEAEQIGLYSQAYDTILKDMHARQHEFKNHLNNIANMHVLYKDYDSLVQNQMSYVGELKASYKYNKLLDTRQPILSGCLYMLFTKYEDSGAEIEYDIEVTDVTAYMPIIELIEVLSVLIDNAFQAVMLLEDIPRKVHIFIEECDELLTIKVRNTVTEEKKYKELSLFFEEGYSTKGKGHGLGLFNAKNIIHRYKGDIVIQSNTVDADAWVIIECNMKKR